MSIFETILPMRRFQRPILGFSLVEVLVVIVLIVTLGGITAVSVKGAMKRAEAIQCAAKMKSLGTAMLLYTQENDGQLPRSFHSAGAHRQPGWAASISPFLGVSESQIENHWPQVFNEWFRSPADISTDVRIYSYGMNVHFELDPDGDDYTGSPTTWRRLHKSPNPTSTVLMAQTRPILFGDHLMCHQWSSVQAAKNALLHDIHSGKSNYLFLDGHVETLRVEETFDPARKLNRWNPSLAR